MSEDNKALNALLDGINLMIDEKLKLAGFDRSVVGFITGANLENNTYTVKINGYEYQNVKSVIGDLGTTMPCICTIPQNQMSQMYISGIIDSTNYIDGGGGGTGGNYNDLENKPSINGVTLVGNKTTSDLGISQPTKTSQLVNDSGFIADVNYVHTDNNFTNALLSKLNGIESGAEVNLINKITVNGVEQAISNKTVALTVMTNTVNDLVNYYTKSETYTKTEVNGLISAIPKFAIEVVNALPTTDISTTTIYLLRNTETTGSNLFEEYIYVNNQWELLGSQDIDLSDYVTTEDLNTALASYVTSTNLSTILQGYVTTTMWNTLGAVATSNSYNDLDDKPTIPTVYDGTLTLKLNGVTAGSFSANQSQNEEIDLMVGGGGHVIQDANGTDLAQRDTLQFGGYLQTTDDSTNEKTVVSDEPTGITWSAWQQMTDAQKEGTKWLITDVPDADGSISADLLTKLWENPNPTSAFAEQNITLSSDDYDFLMYVFKYSTSGDLEFTSIGQRFGTMIECFSTGGTGVYSMRRKIDWNSGTSLTIRPAYTCANGSSSHSVDNTVCVPIIIYGIKKTINLTFDAIASNVSTSASKCMLSDGVTSVEDVIDKGSISVPSDNVKTWSQLLDSLFALIDSSKINEKSVFEYEAVGITKTVYHVAEIIESPKTYAFTRVDVNASVSQTARLGIKASGSTNHIVNSMVGGSIVFADGSNNVVAGGRVIRIIY